MKDALANHRELFGRLEPLKSVFWLFDFDGTLAPIASHPRGAQISQNLKKQLFELSKRYPKRVGVLSGRPIKQLRLKVGLRHIVYGGAHGFELQGPDWRYDYALSPVWKGKIQKLTQGCAPLLKGIPGFWMETKPRSCCLHFRQTKQSAVFHLSSRLRLAKRIAQKLGFRVQEGLKAIEFLPAVPWNKGEAARWLMKKTRATTLFFVGDDTTDESVFRLFGSKHVTVRVGRQYSSRAAYYLRDQQKLGILLKEVTQQ
jgi:trehalose-phosphatase